MFLSNRSIKRYLSLWLVMFCILSGFQPSAALAASSNDIAVHYAYTADEYFFPDQAPGPFVYDEPTEFDHWMNRHVYTHHKPHHRGFDQILTSTEPQIIHGKFHYGDIRKDLEDEWISIYVWRTDMGQWQYLSRMKTDDDGYIHYTLTGNQRLGTGIHPIKMVVEGDTTYANMYLEILDPTQKYVVFDIDGTLTLADSEMIYEVVDGFFTENYEAKPYVDGQKVVRYYVDRGYQIIYLTARPYWLGDISYKWLIDKGYPYGILHTMATGDNSSHDVYKSNYLKSLTAKGVNIEAAYGNALTDITAYKSIGLPLSSIYIIGKNAGAQGTVAISDYTTHYQSLVN